VTDALWRDRLARRLDGIWGHRLGVVVGPAGSGKTTLLASFVARAGVPAAWYRAEASDAVPGSLVAGLACAVRAVGHDPGTTADVGDLAVALERWGAERALLVIDDLHELAGSPAEADVERLATYLPESVRLIVASRREPGFNLPRLRVSGEVLEITPDDLRFRSWEVESLFRDVYREPLPPADLAALAHRTQGWAAGLQLFHLATRGKPLAQRRRILDALAGRSRMVREYLTRNVLDGLPDELRSFLVQTSVLGLLTPQLCDELCRRTGSGALLAELERRQLFTVSVEGEVFRYHEVLRSHLEVILVEELGEDGAAAHLRRAGELLHRTGALPEALRAYWRAQDWQGVAHVLGSGGEELAAASGEWLDALSGPLVEHDPWLVLAAARRHLALGRPNRALEAYQRAAEAFGPVSAGEGCRRERRDLSWWLSPPLAARSDWMGAIRVALETPGAVLRGPEATDVRGSFALAVAALGSGMVHDARSRLDRVSAAPGCGPVLRLVVKVLTELACLLAGEPPPGGPDVIAEEAEAMGWSWIARLSRGLWALDGREEHLAAAAAAREACSADGDVWGAALLALAEALGQMRAPAPAGAGGNSAPGCATDAATLCADAAAAFAGLGATALEAWARAAEALVRAGRGEPAAETLRLAERAVRLSGARGPAALLAAAHEALGRPVREPAAAIAAECGLALPRPGAPPPTGSSTEARTASTGPLSVRCFGGFRVLAGDRPVDLSGVKPRARAVLQMLALHGGATVHRELLVDALWPESGAAVGIRNLQVAISSLRRALEGAGATDAVLRDGDGYRLALPTPGDLDVAAFDEALAAARAAPGVEATTAALERALSVYAGDLIPEAGPVDWAVKLRDAYRMRAAEAAQRLAEIRLAAGDARGAAEACTRGLDIDRYRDGLWRALVAALERAGEPAAAARARRDYEAILAELGVGDAGGP
jgi:DNA-binding SARP family transcriptional activator